MTYHHRTVDVFNIQQWFPWTGWETVTAEDTRQEARARLCEYRQNQPEFPTRIKTTRERITTP